MQTPCGATTVCPEYGGVRILEASGVFLVGMAKFARHAVECYKATFQSSPLL